jgi:hypothetical protein
MGAKTTNCSNTPVEQVPEAAAGETQHVNMQILDRGTRVYVSNPEHLEVELAASCRDEVRLEDRDLKCNLVL